MDRWTNEQLKNITDIDFAITILNERKNKLSNPYSPLYNKLECSIKLLDRIRAGQEYRGPNIWNYQ